MELKNLLLAAGTAAGAAAVLYYLLRDDEVEEKLEAGPGAQAGDSKERKRGSGLDRAELLEILKEMDSIQKKAKETMKVVSKEITEKSLKFEQIYETVKDQQSPNAVPEMLERRGVSTNDFEMAVSMNQEDPEIRMALSGEGPQPTPLSATLSPEKIEEINVYMLEELKKFEAEFQAMPNKSDFDRSLVVAASQAMMDARVNEKFQVTAEDVEGALMMNFEKLRNSRVMDQTMYGLQQAMMGLMQG